MVKQAYTLLENLDTLPVRQGLDTDQGLRDICEMGMRRIGKVNDPVYRARLDEELDVIIGKGFSVYFIILWDMMKFCNENGIVYGLGRGSACGSLVSYLAQITGIDPIPYGLLFWRFLDPERSDMPDIDIDIQDSRRQEVKVYLEEKYGIEHVASISTFNFFSFKSAFKAAARVLCVPYADANDAVKNIETEEDARRDPKFVAVCNAHPGLIKLTKAIEGRMAAVGMHAAGVVVSHMPLTDITSIESRGQEGADFRQKVIGLDKDEAERLGLVKIDLLGLKALSVIADTCEFVRQNTGRLIDWKTLDDTDARVYRMLSEGSTLGVFQAEQSASTELIRKMKVESFNDLVSSNALVRSGAWNAFGPEYLAKKAGKKEAKFPTEQSKEFLSDTFGEALYQEQSMQICKDVAGMTGGESNQVRKLTAKKKSKEELAPYREKFIKGCIENNVSKAEAEKLWANIEVTSEYQFNKCLAEDTEIQIMAIRKSDNYMVLMTSTIGDQFARMRDHENYDYYVSGPSSISGAKVGDGTWHKIKAVHDNGEQPVWRIWTDSETYIDATYNHKHRLSKVWKEAFRIHQNDVIWTDRGKVKVGGRRYAGFVQTYDLELYDEPHAFYANGFVTHNSHAVAYSKLTWATAWLKYHYPAEFMTALLQNEKDTASISDYLAECKRIGIDVRTPDVNKSGLGYTTKDNVIYMGLSNIKYISDKLAQRLIALRPIDSYAQLSDKIFTKKSGLSSRVLDSLNKVGATDFPDHPIDREAIKANFYEYLGIAAFDDGLITKEMQTRVKSLDDLKQTKGDGIVVGIIQDIISKNGWTAADIIDASGKNRVFLDQDHGLEKGKKYILAIAGSNLIMHMDMSEYNTQHPLVKYLRGEMSVDTWFVAAKSRKTSTGNMMATIMFSHNDELFAVKVFSDMMATARQFGPGMKVRVGLNQSKKWGPSLKHIIKDDR